MSIGKIILVDSPLGHVSCLAIGSWASNGAKNEHHLETTTQPEKFGYTGNIHVTIAGQSLL